MGADGACRTAAQWPDDLKIAVNLSPVQFSPPISSKWSKALADTGLRRRIGWSSRSPSGSFMEDSEKTLSSAASAQGHSAFASPWTISAPVIRRSAICGSSPFDKIKVDRTFVSDPRGGHRARRHRAGGGQHRARARHDDHRRRRRDGGQREFLDGARLRRSAGLSVQRAGADREGSGVDDSGVEKAGGLRLERFRRGVRP